MNRSEHNLTTQITKQVDMDYLLYLPEESAPNPPPLMLFLHGAGERGDDLSLVKKNGGPPTQSTGSRCSAVQRYTAKKL